MIPVSVIVPVYNVSGFMSRCVDSIINQTMKNIEIILVDDGSTDGSGSICDSYSNQDKRIKVIHKQNEGLVSARRSGVAVAHGEYILHVDSDDWIEPFHIELLYHTAITNNADIVGCNYCKNFSDGSELLFSNAPDSLFVNDYLISLLTGKIHSGVVFRLFSKELYSFPDVHFPICDFNEDLHHTISLAIHAKKIIHCDTFSYHYRINDNSLTQQRKPQYIISKYIEFARNMEDLNNTVGLCKFLGSEKEFYKMINNRKRTMIVNNIEHWKEVKEALTFHRGSFKLKDIHSLSDLFYFVASKWGIILPYIIRNKIRLK